MKNGLGGGWSHWGERRVTVAAGDDSRMPGEKLRGLDQYAEWAEDRSPRIWCTDEGKSDTIYWLIGCGTGRKERYWVSLWGYWLETWWCLLKEKSRVQRAGEGGEKQERRFEQEQLWGQRRWMENTEALLQVLTPAASGSSWATLNRSFPHHFHRSLSHRGNMGVGKTTSQACLNKETRCLCCRHQVESNSFVTLWTTAHQAPCPWSILGKNTGVGCHFLLQGIFPGQEANPHLLFSRRILYHWATCVYHVSCKGTESNVNCLFLLLLLIHVYLNNSYMNLRLCLK